MKGIHTSDWHLGKVLHGVSLLPEQKEQIQQITALIRQEQVDFVAVSGDLYDRAIPPTEAIDLWETTLEEWVETLGIQVFVIAGNHDSAKRLSFGHRFLEKQRVSILGDFSRLFEPLTVESDGVRMQVHFLPYLDTAYLRDILDLPEIRSREFLLDEAMKRVRQGWDEQAFHLLLAHEFLLGGTTSDSERPLSVGGNQAVPYTLFDQFDYVALGHLHRAQKIGNEKIRYAGGLYPYSFSEAGRVPSVELLEVDKNHHLSRSRLPIAPKRTLRVVEGSLEEVLDMPETDDYLSVLIQNSEVILDLMGKLRERFPNTLRVERSLSGQGAKDQMEAEIGERESTETLFERFFTAMTDQDLSIGQKEYLGKVLSEIEGGE